MEVYIDDETKLTLHGLQQYYVKLQDKEKNRKLFDLLDVLEFNQVCGHIVFTVQMQNVEEIVYYLLNLTIPGGHICEECPEMHSTGTASG